MDLIVIDGPNLYNRVVEHIIRNGGASDASRDYVRTWLDFDRLARATVGQEHAPSLGIVIFHSRRGLGPKGPLALRGEDADAFWARQGGNPNSSCWLVDVPSRAGASDDEDREKGVDMSIATYLFETMERWEAACIFSSDADFVPVVQSLRRRGKRVFVSGDNSERTKALVRYSQSFFPVSFDHVDADRAVIEFLRSSGGVDGALTRLRSDASIQRPMRGRCYFTHDGTGRSDCSYFRECRFHLQVDASNGESIEKAVLGWLTPSLGSGRFIRCSNEEAGIEARSFILHLVVPDVVWEGWERHLSLIFGGEHPAAWLGHMNGVLL